MAQGRRTRGPNGTSPLMWVLAVLLTIVLVLGAALILLVTQRYREEDQSQEVVTIGGQEVVIDQSLPQSDLEEYHFTTEADGTITYSGPAQYGIDVSSHQGEIDWSAVAGDGVEFAFLRIGYRGYTEGALNLDTQFQANLEGAQEAGIQVAVYFFSQAVDEEEAREEARQVLAWLEEFAVGDCWVAYDWEHIEDDTARTADVSGETVTACARAFSEEITAGGCRPIVYCNGMLGYLSYDLTQLEDLPLWYAEYQDYPSYAYEVTVWQYTESGSVAGVTGEVDRNIWFLEEETSQESPEGGETAQ